jgi:hypothetical protein
MRSAIVVPSKGTMKTIKKNELFQNLGGFLKSKGIELTDGAYSQRINRACDVLTDAINDTNKTVKRARTKINQGLDQLRQSIHQATAPEPAEPPKTTGKGKANARRARSSSAKKSKTK